MTPAISCSPVYNGFLVIAGVNNTGAKFITGVVDIGEQLSPVTKTPTINLSPVTRTRTSWSCQIKEKVDGDKSVFFWAS
jgi:hypothetical protein